MKNQIKLFGTYNSNQIMILLNYISNNYGCHFSISCDILLEPVTVCIRKYDLKFLKELSL